MSSPIRAKFERCAVFSATALGALSVSLALTGCGSGVSNLLPPAVATPNANTPSGPALGYVFTPLDGTLRAMLGVRGSARLSASIVPAGVYVAGDASTASGAALLEDEAGSLFAFTLPLSQPTHVADGLPAGAHIVFAPGGENAIAYATGGSTMTLVTGLPAAPRAQSIALAGAGALYAATVSDAGTVVAAAQGSSSGAAMQSAPLVQPIGATGLNHPLAVAASQDRHWAAVANGGDANILRVDLTTGSPVQKLSCTCQPSLMSSLAGNAVFRVSTLGTGPLWTVDMATATPQLLFVPAIHPTKTP
jgi:hypothetical protein